MGQKLTKLKEEVRSAFSTPALKQKEAYGRFCHTLASASIVGFVTVIHLDNKPSWFIVERAIALFCCGVAMFIVGSILSQGE